MTAIDHEAPESEPRPTRRAALIATAAATMAIAAACRPAPAASTTTTVPRTTTTQPRTTTTTVPRTTTTTVPRTTTTTVPRTTTTQPQTTTTVPTTTVPTTGQVLTASMVARRLSYGPTPELIAQIERATPAGWIEDQLRDAPSRDAQLDADLAAALPRTRASAAANAANAPWEMVADLPAATTVRAIAAERQVFELVVAFLWDRFNVDVHHSDAQPACGEYDHMLRTHAFGRFADLLQAVARSTAMLNYLNQATSRADGDNTPNENFARELMELHTVGADAGYDDDDVVAVAHLLSGWTTTSVGHRPLGSFTFDARRHHLGPFTDPQHQVLGWSRNHLTGLHAGEAFVDHLAHHDATATRLAHALAIRFIGDHVRSDDALVRRAADAYHASDTSIVAVLRVLFTSDEFAASTERRIRRPLELYAAMVRAIARPGYDRTKLAASRWALVSATSYLAGTPHHWPDPNGYPDLDQAWVSAGSMISRWNMATWVLTNLPEAFDLDWSFIRSWASAPTVGAWCDAAERRLDIVLPTAQRNQMLTELYRTASSPLAASGTDWVIRRVLNQYLQHPRMNLR